MKYKAIIMVPKIMDFESEGQCENVSNQAWALCNNFDSVIVVDDYFYPRLLTVLPIEDLKTPLVFDPPPMAA